MNVIKSNAWCKMAEIYTIFARNFDADFTADFTDEMAEEMYNYETYGVGKISKNNGFSIGKKYMDVQIASWKEDIESGLLCKFELYEDSKYTSWFWEKIGLKSWQLNYSKEFIQAKVDHMKEIERKKKANVK